ncbi:MAG: hypothetical protein HPKKFMNG_01512 [Planctomycetes bacterium]|nr:hypothetical protein [Planctomycetota bacterium]
MMFGPANTGKMPMRGRLPVTLAAALICTATRVAGTGLASMSPSTSRSTPLLAASACEKPNVTVALAGAAWVASKLSPPS